MGRAIVTLLLVASTFAFPGTFRVAHSDPVPEGGPVSIDSHFDDDLAEVIAKARRREWQSSSVTNVNSSPPRYVTTYVPACPSNSPSEASPDALCTEALDACSAMGQEGVLYWIYRGLARGAGAEGGWQFVGQQCRAPEDVPEAAVPVFSAADFRRLPLPAGEVNVQPPNGRTLINVPTNVFVDADEVTLPTELLGFPVRVRAAPSRFIWRFGDGGKLSTKDKGAPYPDLRTTHTYKKPGSVRVRLTTVYTGEYSVAGGPFLPIDGTAEVQSPAAGLTVLAAENHLVADPVP